MSRGAFSPLLLEVEETPLLIDVPARQTFIGEYPSDGREYDCQCARCGSSVFWEDCQNCGGEGTDGHDCGEDCCCCLNPEDNVRCDQCYGKGGEYVCCSTAEWCELHPMQGRTDTESGTPEWFCIEPQPVEAAGV